MIDMMLCTCVYLCFFFQAEDGIRDLVRSRGLGDVYKRQQGESDARRAQHRDHGVGDFRTQIGRVAADVVEHVLSLIHI